MQIQVDTREHQSEWARISKQFDDLGVTYFRSKLYVGDYCSVDNPRTVIDRKKDLQELCGNVTQGHERFRKELIRAKESGFHIIILVEHGKDIKELEDVYFWKNPRKYKVTWKTENGKRVKKVISAKAVDGEQLYKSLNTIKDRYDVEFYFCTKDKTGEMILDLLRGAI